MRQVLSTALVALIVGALAGATVSAVAQSPAQSPAEPVIVPSAVSTINADKVDGRHAVGSGATKAKRARKLVATNSSGFLPSNIVKPYWAKIKNKPAAFADGRIGWGEVKNKPAGFADGVDNKGVTGVTITTQLNAVDIPSGATISYSAICPAGSQVTGGGFTQTTNDLYIQTSRPRSGESGWVVTAKNPAGVTRNLSVYAMCLSTTPASRLH